MESSPAQREERRRGAVVRPYRGVSAAERRDHRRARLVEAGRELFGTRGIASVGVGDVCAQADLTKRYFYESFPSIDELLEAVIEDALDYLTRRVVDSAAPGGAGTMRQTLEAFIGALVEDPRLLRLLVVETYSGALVGHRRRFIEQAVAFMLVSDHLKGDKARALASLEAAYAFVGATGEIMVAWLDGRIAVDQPGLIDLLVDLGGRLDGLQAPSAN